MKTEQDIIDLKKQLLNELVQLSNRHGHSFSGTAATSDQLHWMGLGAVAFANAVLELKDRPDNLGKMIETLGQINKLETKEKNPDGKLR